MIYFFTKGDERIPGPRRRVYRLSEHLQTLGYQSEIHVPTHRPWWNISRARFTELLFYFSLFRGMTKSDIVYLHRPIYQIDFMALVLIFRCFGRKYIFDFDDAIFVHSPVKTWIMTRLAWHVIVAGQYLFDYASKINNHSQIIPMLLDPIERHPMDMEKKNISFIIGWIGDAGVHAENLRILPDVLRELSKRGRTVHFRLIGAGNNKSIYELFANVGQDVELIDWIEFDKVWREVQKFDVALMPLIDTPWNRGKCPIKHLEYLQGGIPTVASKVGEAIYVIQDGFNGLLVENSARAWATAIERLLDDQVLRKSIALHGQQTIRDKYSYAAYLKLYQRLFQDFVSGSIADY